MGFLMERIKLLSIRLKELRETLGLSQSAFAESIGLKQQTYSAYEKGTNKPPIDVIMKIEEEYRVSLDWLCGFTNLPKEKINLSTCADVLHLLFELGTLDGIEIDNGFVRDTSGPNEFPNNDTSYEPFMMIYFDDTTINNVLIEWKKMFDLYQDQTIDEEVYRLWMEKTLKKYNIPYHPNKGVRSQETEDLCQIPDGLPFT